MAKIHNTCPPSPPPFTTLSKVHLDVRSELGSIVSCLKEIVDMLRSELPPILEYYSAQQSINLSSSSPANTQSSITQPPIVTHIARSTTTTTNDTGNYNSQEKNKQKQFKTCSSEKIKFGMTCRSYIITLLEFSKESGKQVRKVIEFNSYAGAVT